MLPESKDGQALYISVRDLFNRFRREALTRAHGDQEALKAHVFDHLDLMAEFAQFRESVDFADEEGFLTEDQARAAENAIRWGQEFRKLIAHEVPQ